MSNVFREIAVKFGMAADPAGFNYADKRIDGLIRGAQNLATSLGIAFGVRALKSFVDENLAAAGAINDTAAKLGISAEAFQEWNHVAGQAGVSAESVQKAVTFLNKSMGEAELGNKKFVELFQKLGINLKNTDGSARNVTDVMLQLTDVLKALPDDATRVAIAQKLLGRGGKDLALIFGQGSEAIAQQIKDLHEVGGVLSGETANALDKVDDRLKTLSEGWSVTKMKIVALLIPALEWLSNAFGAVLKRIQQIVGNSASLDVLKTVLLGIAVIMLPLVSGTLAWVAAITAAVLIGDDLLAFLSGGNSLIGDFITYITDAETATSIANGTLGIFKALWIGIAESIDMAASGLKGFVQLLKGDFSGAKSTFEAFIGRTGGRKTELMNAFSGPSVSAALPGALAAPAPSALSVGAATNSRVSNNKVNNTINITTNNPEEVKRAVKDVLQLEYDSSMDNLIEDTAGDFE